MLVKGLLKMKEKLLGIYSPEKRSFSETVPLKVVRDGNGCVISAFGFEEKKPRATSGNMSYGIAKDSENHKSSKRTG